MRVGIYGDSFTCCCEPEHAPARWTALLAQWGYDVTVHGAPGSNLLWSLDQFTATQHLYDRIIYVVTNPVGRLWFGKFMNIDFKPPVHTASITDPYIPPHQRDGSYFCPGVGNIQNTLYRGEYNPGLLRGLQQYYNHIQTDYVDWQTHRYLLEIIELKRPDAVLVPAFWDSLLPREDDHHSAANTDEYTWLERLSSLDKTDNPSIQRFLNKRYGKGNDNRPCHMSFENNYRFAQIVKHYLDTGEWNFLCDRDAWYQSQTPEDMFVLHPEGRPLG